MTLGLVQGHSMSDTLGLTHPQKCLFSEEKIISSSKYSLLVAHLFAFFPS